ncbi:MAG TPA: O-methyltransferase, partial [Flavitalea sp.]|nr:O-methyltransferase [Flavitalea sp.]
ETRLQAQISTETNRLHAQPHMMSSRVQGKFLEIFSKLIRPSRILEIGTLTGYSAICLAEGLTADGKLHTIELREEDAITAATNFRLSKFIDRIILHTGNALQVVPTLKENWDLVFLDADKTGYLDYYQLILPKMKQGGVMIADNVLFHGQVLEQPVTGKSALAIEAFNRFVSEDERVEQVVLTVRDGLMIIRKK